MRDLYNNITIKQSLAPASRTGTADGTTVDVQNYESVVAVLDAGTGVGSALESFTFILYESDDGSTWSAVATADLIAGSGETSTITITTANDAQVHKRGYVGTSRYLRWEITAEADSFTLPCSAYVVLGNYRHAPVP